MLTLNNYLIIFRKNNSVNIQILQYKYIDREGVMKETIVQTEDKCI